MLKKQIIIILSSLFIFTSQGYVKNNAEKTLLYNILTDEQIKSSSLQFLLINRAEVYASRGYKFKGKYLKNEILKKSWYKPKNNFNLSLFTDKEKNYISKLTEQIESLKKIILKQKLEKLKSLLKDKVIIKFAQLSDINGDGEYDLVVICGKKFKFKIDKNAGNETIYYYYNGHNELYLLFFSSKNGSNYFSQSKLTREHFGIAEFISSFDFDYFIGNGELQIKIVIHSFSLNKEIPKVHKERIYLFALDNSKLINIFSHEIYSSSMKKNNEIIENHLINFKNLIGNYLNEIILQKKLIKRTYFNILTSGKSHSDYVYYENPIYFKFDSKKKVYKKFKYNKKK
ncbi:MAG: YARHG domain-containing protein [Spirochaetota bacterium]|nr:YARHG domain-containing protein [Spirochaetota bacterium]